MQIVCIGAGYVGGPTMAVIAKNNPHIRVVVCDKSETRINAWNSSNLPIFEPGLSEIVSQTRGKNLFFEVIDPKHYQSADLIFVSVNTPTKMFGVGAGMAPDMQYIESCARDILRYARSETIIVEKSTVPVRTAETMATILNSADKKFTVLSNPEFLAEGSAVADLENPDRILIGHDNTPTGESAADKLKAIYGAWVKTEKILLTNVWSSELSKLVANAFLAQRISSINAISALCEKTNAVVGEISKAVGMDSRIGAKFLEASVGFGGSCFKKDILNLVYICRSNGLYEIADYWESVIRINDYQSERFVQEIISQQFNTVAGKKIAILGFAFKANTNDTRESPAIYVCKKLLEEKAHLAIHDPKALDDAKHDLRGIDANVEYCSDVEQAISDAHAIALLTPWSEYSTLDFKRIYEKMKKPAFIFDGRRILPYEKLTQIGFRVFQLGRKQ